MSNGTGEAQLLGVAAPRLLETLLHSRRRLPPPPLRLARSSATLAQPHLKSTASLLGPSPSCSATSPWYVSWLEWLSRNCCTSSASRTAASPGDVALLAPPEGAPPAAAAPAAAPAVPSPTVPLPAASSGCMEAAEGCGVAGRCPGSTARPRWLVLGLSNGDGGSCTARTANRTVTGRSAPAASSTTKLSWTCSPGTMANSSGSVTLPPAGRAARSADVASSPSPSSVLPLLRTAPLALTSGRAPVPWLVKLGVTVCEVNASCSTRHPAAGVSEEGAGQEKQRSPKLRFPKLRCPTPRVIFVSGSQAATTAASSRGSEQQTVHSPHRH